VSAGILRGVTRRFVIDTLAPMQGMKVIERAMKVEELLAADEVFLTGTAAEVIGVSSIDGRRIGTGVVGPVTKRLEAEFKRIVAKDAPED
jgi:branched-chain amino acid aminotransferase